MIIAGLSVWFMVCKLGCQQLRYFAKVFTFIPVSLLSFQYFLAVPVPTVTLRTVRRQYGAKNNQPSRRLSIIGTTRNGGIRDLVRIFVHLRIKSFQSPWRKRNSRRAPFISTMAESTLISRQRTCADPAGVFTSPSSPAENVRPLIITSLPGVIPLRVRVTSTG